MVMTITRVFTGLRLLSGIRWSPALRNADYPPYGWKHTVALKKSYQHAGFEKIADVVNFGT
jgi:hypothetical protein